MTTLELARKLELCLAAQVKLQRERDTLREAARAVSAMLVDTPRDRLGRLDIVATETRERVRVLAVKYKIDASDYMDQCGKILRAALAQVQD